MLLLLTTCEPAFACLDGAEIWRNRQIAQTWGNIGLELAVPVMLLQVWRRGVGATTIGLMLTMAAFVLVNPGLHFNGLRGDCGFADAAGARWAAGFMGLMLGYQVIVSLRRAPDRPSPETT